MMVSHDNTELSTHSEYAPGWPARSNAEGHVINRQYFRPVGGGGIPVVADGAEELLRGAAGTTVGP